MKDNLIRHSMILDLSNGWLTRGGLLLSMAIVPGWNVWAAVETHSEVYVASVATVQGNGGSGAKLSLFSLQSVRPVECAGTLTAFGTQTVTDANAGWLDDQFNGANGSFYIEFDNGMMMDITATTGASKTLTLAAALPAGISVGEAYRIRAHCTVASVFGAGNEAGLQSGLNPTSADNVLLYIPKTQQTMTIFFYDDGLGGRGWLRADYSLAANQVIYPQQGIMVRRKTAGTVFVFQSGREKEGPRLLAIQPGYNLVGTLEAGTNIKLSELNLYTGDSQTGLSCGLNPTVCDNLLVVQPNGSTATYFYFNDLAGGEGWLDASYALANDTTIAAGSAFLIRRKPPGGAFNWSIPPQ
jgi:hypothetical protein